MIDHFAVIIPAHNEQDEIAGCMEAVMRSLDRAQKSFGDVHFRVIAVADACTDDTTALLDGIAGHNPIVEIVTVWLHNVGRARNAAAEHLIRSAVPPGRQKSSSTWFAFTDADSRVPLNWVAVHLESAGHGADCLVGTVAPRPDTGSAELLAKWHAAHDLTEDHPHVFGANLGIRASYFDLIGGIPPLHCGEDEAVVAAVFEAGGSIRRTDACRVLTSARLESRVVGGFSGYLQRLL